MREVKEINYQVGSAIKSARERAGLTQEQFGELVSLGPKNVSCIERGLVGVSLSTLKRICEKLSVSSDELLFGRREQSDASGLASRLERLSPAQFAAVKDFLDQVLLLYARLDD